MDSIKKILMLAVIVIIFVIGTGTLLEQYFVYKRSYQELANNISHASIENEVIMIEQE